MSKKVTTIKEPSTDTLLRLAELVLTLSFNGDFFKQINGVAMGTKMGPSYANLFVGYVEVQIFRQYMNGPKPELFGRYIDCLGATYCTKDELDHFIQFVDSFHPALNFTWEVSDTMVTFLDIKIAIH